jgi:hypothetical protein
MSLIKLIATGQLGSADDLARLAAYILVNGLNCGDQVHPEPDWIVVALVKGQPRRLII